MMIQTILTATWAGFAALFGNQASFERPLICGPAVGLIYGNLGLGLAIGGTLELMWMGVEGIGGASPANVTLSSIFATAMACKLGYGVPEAVALAVPVSLLGQVINQLLGPINVLAQRRFEALAEEGKIDALITWAWWHFPKAFVQQFLIIYLALAAGTGPVQALLDSVPAWLLGGLGTAGGILPAVGFAMVLRMMYKLEYLPFLIVGFVLGAYLNMPILAVALIATGVAAILFMQNQKIKEGGQA